MQNLDVRMTLFKILVQIYIPRNTFNKHINSGFCLSLCNEDHIKRKKSFLKLSQDLQLLHPVCLLLDQNRCPVKGTIEYVVFRIGPSIPSTQRTIFAHLCLQVGHLLSPETEIYTTDSLLCPRQYTIYEITQMNKTQA